MSQFARPPIFNLTDKDTPLAASQVGGNNPGLVSLSNGGLANLPFGQTTIECFDLGPNWQDYSILQITLSFDGSSVGLNPVIVTCADNTVQDTRRRLRPNNTAGIFDTSYMNWVAGSSYNSVLFRPSGRYVHLQVTSAEASGALGAQSVARLTLYPN